MNKNLLGVLKFTWYLIVWGFGVYLVAFLDRSAWWLMLSLVLSIMVSQ